jgi:hypothetical protein
MRKADLVKRFDGRHTSGAVYRAIGGLVTAGQVAVAGDVVALVADG